MTPLQLKTWGTVAGLVVTGLLLRRRASAATSGDPGGLVGICVSGADGDTACGGDDVGTSGGPLAFLGGIAQWFGGRSSGPSSSASSASAPDWSSWWQPSTVTKGDEQTPDAW